MKRELIEVCKKHLTNSRPGDWEHTLRTVEWIRFLIEHEGGDPEILIPAAYLHDIGWSIALPPQSKKRGIEVEVVKRFLDLHMKKGAELSRQILTNLSYPKDKAERIVHLVSIHDYPERISEKDEILLMEADRLDRFGKIGLKRIMKVIKKRDWKKVFPLIRKESKNWFKSRTGKRVYEKLLKEMEKELNKLSKTHLGI